jgi:hypothetical protein
MAQKPLKEFNTHQILNLGVSIVIGTVVFGLAVFVKPAQPSLHDGLKKGFSNDIAHEHYIALPPKAPPPSPPPIAVASVIKPTSKPAPAKAVPQTGTPKVEPVVTPSPNSDVSGLTPTTPTDTSGGGSGGESAQVTTSYASLNWSGYMAVHGVFTSVSGAWVATNPAGNGRTVTADSTWIGIGGVTKDDLIQVGTQNIITPNGQVTSSAFYELLPDYSQPVPGVTVSPGDNMTATISQISDREWSISITNKTSGQSNTFNVDYSSSLSSAEWIEEAPSFASGRIIPLANFHTSSFSEGSTKMNGNVVGIAKSTAQPVTMVDRAWRVLAAPSVLGIDGASFTVTQP